MLQHGWRAASERLANGWRVACERLASGLRAAGERLALATVWQRFGKMATVLRRARLFQIYVKRSARVHREVPVGSVLRTGGGCTYIRLPRKTKGVLQTSPGEAVSMALGRAAVCGCGSLAPPPPHALPERTMHWIAQLSTAWSRSATCARARRF